MQQPCAVFWDIENCSVPNGNSSYKMLIRKGIKCFELVRRLKSLLQQIHQKNFGYVYQYLEIIAVGNLKQIPDITRKELQDSGVVTIDCASGKPSAADISLLIEIMKVWIFLWLLILSLHINIHFQPQSSLFRLTVILQNACSIWIRWDTLSW